MARPGLFSKSKFLRLAQKMGSEALAVGHLELMWHAAYENMSDTFKDSTELEAAARWPGEPGALAALLVDAGFVDKRTRGSHSKYIVHDFWDHAPEYVRKRLARSIKEKAERRAKRRPVRTTSGREPVRTVSGQRRTTAAVVQHSPPVPSPPGSSPDSESSPEASGGSEVVVAARARKTRSRRADPSPVPGLSEFKTHVLETWGALHREKPPWSRAEWSVLTRAYRDNLGADLERAKAAWNRYLESRDPYHTGHDPKRFAADLSKFVGTPPEPRRFQAARPKGGLQEGPELDEWIRAGKSGGGT